MIAACSKQSFKLLHQLSIASVYSAHHPALSQTPRACCTSIKRFRLPRVWLIRLTLASRARHSTVLQVPWATQPTLNMGDVVDLTFSDSEDDMAARSSPAAVQKPVLAAEDEDQQQRKRIMDFAQNKAAASDPKRLKPSSPLHPAAGFAGLDGAASEAKAADSTVSSPGGANAADAAAAGSASPAVGQGGGISNADLRALHEARLRRQQQQQQQQQQSGSTGGTDAAAGGDSAVQKHATEPEAAGSSPATIAAAAAGGRGSRRSRSPPAARPGSTSAAAARDTAAGAGSSSSSSRKSISLLTYNVWFKEEVAVLERMIGLGDIVRKAGLPTFICLQEVTPLILEILSNMEWWQQYECSPHPFDMAYFTLLLVRKSAAPGISQSAFDDQPFRNSVMARGLRSVKTSIGGNPILVVTTHLESPIPPQNFYSRERQQQMAEALKALDASATGNVLFAGDMNWEDKRDGAPPLPASWCDAWATLHPGKPGFTYDAKNNPMLPYKGLALRLDRVLCKLHDWRLDSVELVGSQPLQGIKYTHNFRNGGSKELPVLPSDHFGVLVNLAEV